MAGTSGFEFDAYLLMLVDPAFAEYSVAEFAKEFEVTTTTIYNWNKKVDWDEIKAGRRKNYAKSTLSVDSSLFKATKKLDVAAIRTWYERFDNWTPASKISTEHTVSDGEIDKELNDLIERKRAAARALEQSGRGEVAPIGSGEGQASEGRAPAVLQSEPGAGEVHSGDKP